MISNSNQFLNTGHAPGHGSEHNPSGTEIPVGLGMQLAMRPEAMQAFGRLSPQQKNAMIADIQNATSGADAKNRIAGAVESLSQGGMQ